MNFDYLNISKETTETLKAIYGNVKKHNQDITETLFIEHIIANWLEPYKRTEECPAFPKDKAILNNNLKQAIKLTGKTQIQVATEIGVNPKYLGHVINRRCEPSITLALLLAKSLRYPPEKINDLFYLEAANQE